MNGAFQLNVYHEIIDELTFCRFLLCVLLSHRVLCWFKRRRRSRLVVVLTAEFLRLIYSEMRRVSN